MHTFITAILSGLAIILAIVILCIWLWKIKENYEGTFFTFSKDGLSEQSEKIKRILNKFKVDDELSSKTLLFLEEITMKMHEHTDQVITAHLRRRWGRTSITLTSTGEKYNPIEMSTDNAESVDYMRDKIFEANQSLLKYKRKFNKNFITIYIRSV